MRLVCVAAACTALFASASALAQGATITVQNNSAWAFHQLFISAVNDDAWGPDQLGAQTISSGESLQVVGIPCDTYDIKLVDEDGDECLVEDVDFCADDNIWTVDDDMLLSCQVLSN